MGLVPVKNIVPNQVSRRLRAVRIIVTEGSFTGRSLERWRRANHGVRFEPGSTVWESRGEVIHRCTRGSSSCSTQYEYKYTSRELDGDIFPDDPDGLVAGSLEKTDTIAFPPHF